MQNVQASGGPTLTTLAVLASSSGRVGGAASRRQGSRAIPRESRAVPHGSSCAVAHV